MEDKLSNTSRRQSNEISRESAKKNALKFPNKGMESAVTPNTFGRNLCENRLIFWGQDDDEEICWFISILITTFYSQRLRRKMFKAARQWRLKGQNNKLFTVLEHILRYKYVKSNNAFKDIIFLKDYSALNILKLFEQYDKNYPHYGGNQGFVLEYFIMYFCKNLGLNSTMINVYSDGVALYNSIELYRKDGILKRKINPKIYQNTLETPDILLVNLVPTTLQNEFRYVDGILSIDDIISYILPQDKQESVTSLQDEIIYNGQNYVLDAVILDNWNELIGKHGHVIAGITCKGKKYVYNGWKTENYIDPITGNTIKVPCKLQRHDWNIKDIENSFCLNSNGCSFLPNDPSDLCFSFGKGNRMLFYVRSNKSAVNSVPGYETYTKNTPTSYIDFLPTLKRKRTQIKSSLDREQKKARPIQETSLNGEEKNKKSHTKSSSNKKQMDDIISNLQKMDIDGGNFKQKMKNIKKHKNMYFFVNGINNKK